MLMKTRWIAIILIVALLGAATGCTSPEMPRLALGSYDLTAADQALKVAAGAKGAALLVLKDGKIIERQGYGHLGTASIVDIGSASRWLAAAAMMTLVDQGLITLDDPVAKYLPAFAGNKAGITIRQLWSFTSGLPADDPSLADRGITLEACVQKLSTLVPQTAPDTSIVDSAVGIQIGARICEVVSGQSWEEFFQERIAEPLGMQDTSFALLGFSRNPSVGGDARSTADDYARFLTMLLQQGVWQGKRILSQQAVAAIEQDQAATLSFVQQTPFAPFATLLPSALAAHPGLGMWREQTDAAGNLVVASCPSTAGFLPWIDLSRNLVGVLVLQQDVSSAASTYVHLQQLVDAGIAAGPRFRDVQAGSWAFSAIADCSTRGLIQGYEDGTFHPNEALTRAQFARLICLAQKIAPATVTAAPFTDVPAAYWAAGSIAAAVRQGLLSGYQDRTFRPEDPLTLAQALSVLARMGGWSATTAAALPYTDVPAAYWARQAIATCFSHGLLKTADPGLMNGGKLSPDGRCTRAQACVLLDRFLTATAH